MIPKLKNKDDYIYTVLDIANFQTFIELKFSR